MVKPWLLKLTASAQLESRVRGHSVKPDSAEGQELRPLGKSTQAVRKRRLRVVETLKTQFALAVVDPLHPLAPVMRTF